jgi:hypothetical protein
VRRHNTTYCYIDGLDVPNILQSESLGPKENRLPLQYSACLILDLERCCENIQCFNAGPSQRSHPSRSVGLGRHQARSQSYRHQTMVHSSEGCVWVQHGCILIQGNADDEQGASSRYVRERLRGLPSREKATTVTLPQPFAFFLIWTL